MLLRPKKHLKIILHPQVFHTHYTDSQSRTFLTRQQYDICDTHIVVWNKAKALWASGFITNLINLSEELRE